MLVLKTSNFQGATISTIVPRHKSTGFQHNESFGSSGIWKTFAKVELYLFMLP